MQVGLSSMRLFPQLFRFLLDMATVNSNSSVRFISEILRPSRPSPHSCNVKQNKFCFGRAVCNVKPVLTGQVV
jgi:hypothetical protein